jgi:hypothetical protein
MGSSLTSVSFPKVTTIGSSAFNGCTSLPTVSFPAVQTIGTAAFVGCTSLVTVSFPAVQTISNNAFYSYGYLSCQLITSITIAANAETNPAFQGGDEVRFAGFAYYYRDTASKAAGTYTWNGSAWTGPN